MGSKQNYTRGVLLGLAVGDAMGHTVDKRTLEQIREDYGPNGLLGYDLVNGYADVTSYTQIASFSANALLIGLTHKKLRGKLPAPYIRYIGVALREWSRSQHYSTPERNYCWLSGVPKMKRRFCMDTRMLDALSKDTLGTPEAPFNSSNHPSALTAVVPISLMWEDLDLDQAALDRLGAETVALTHGDPETFLTGAALTHMLCLLLQDSELSVDGLLQHTAEAMQQQFGQKYSQVSHICQLLQLARNLAASPHIHPMEAMEQLRCGTAAEVLAGALYAVATCAGDFDAAMITAVNHSGRSAAVGAVAGAILGAILGEHALPEFYLESLEPTATLTELADDLTVGCPMSYGGSLFDDDWDRKYLRAGA